MQEREALMENNASNLPLVSDSTV